MMDPWTEIDLAFKSMDQAFARMDKVMKLFEREQHVKYTMKPKKWWQFWVPTHYVYVSVRNKQ